LIADGLRGRPVCWLILPAATDINAVRIQAAFVVLLRVAVLLLLLREPQRDRATRFVYAISGFYYRAMLCIRGTSHGPVSVRPSQAGVLLKRQNIGSHKQHHTIPPGTLVFWCQRSPRNSTWVTPYGGAKCRWGGSKSATFDK